eukprot:scaffold47603_cov68-Phaeocystis_antarctica.AAC.4
MSGVSPNGTMRQLDRSSADHALVDEVAEPARIRVASRVRVDPQVLRPLGQARRDGQVDPVRPVTAAAPKVLRVLAVHVAGEARARVAQRVDRVQRDDRAGSERLSSKEADAMQFRGRGVH